MKAIIQQAYGSPEVFKLRQMDKPEPKGDEVRIKVLSAGLHAGDLFTMKGEPFLVRLQAGWPKPRTYIPGFDVAGKIDAAGPSTQRFQPGDEVYGACKGSCAEYVCVKASTLMPRPANLSFTQAAAVPTSGLTALIGLRDAGKVRPGQKVLINGASGGVGTFAVQMAKAFGAEVTGVCSTSKMDMVRSLGADHVIDYTREDFTRGDQRYDMILDHGASHNLSDCWRALTPDGVHVPNSGLGGIGFVLKAVLASLFVRKQGRPFVVNHNREEMTALDALITSGEVTPVIDRTFPLEEASEAFRYLDEGRAKGKIVITVGDEEA